MKQPITIQDLFAIELVSDPRFSPDGESFAWIQTTIERDADTYRSAIWVSIAGQHRKLTSGLHRDTEPVWSPDGQQIAFVSNRPTAFATKTTSPETPAPKAVNQIWLISVDGGEAHQLTNAEFGAASPEWSPTGTILAYTTSDAPTDDERDQAPTALNQIADERLIRGIHYRADGKGYLDRFTHIWLADTATHSIRQLTTGPYHDTQPTWSPDGTELAFTSNRRPDAAEQWDRSAIYRVAITSDVVSQVSPDEARFSGPAWSPDGTRIAFTGYLGTSSAALDAVWTCAPDGSELVNHTRDIDLGCSDSGMSDVAGSGDSGLQWHGNDHIRFLASASGETQVHQLSVSSGTTSPITSGKHRVAGFSSAGDDLLVVRSSINRPFELERWRDGMVEAAITSINSDVVINFDLMDAEDLTFTSADGTEIQGWLIPPRGYDPSTSTRHPLIVQIHGGPHSMYGYAMFHEMQVMASRGYAVAFSNPRGSAGYGHEFQACTKGVWGTADMPDVIALVDEVSSRPWIDSDRIGITGGSYGGYLTNWIVAHDQRFKAAVTQRCVSSFLSFFGTSDIGTTFGVSEFDGLPWSDTEKLFRQSPIAYVDKIDTPLLILHSEQDLRCPIEQAEQMFASLKYLNKETLLIRFPEEGHELSRSGTPSRRVARLTHLLGWFDRYL